MLIHLKNDSNNEINIIIATKAKRDPMYLASYIFQKYYNFNVEKQSEIIKQINIDVNDVFKIHIQRKEQEKLIVKINGGNKK